MVTRFLTFITTSSVVADNESVILAALRNYPKNATQRGKSNFKRMAVNLLKTTPSERIRNAAALALININSPKAKDIIIDVLHRPEVIKSSGTLLFALSELGASIPLNMFVDVIERGSLEARAEVLGLMDEGKVEPPSDDELRTAKQRLERLVYSEDNERAEAAKVALDYVQDAVTNND